jgi:hypothetical protein
MPQNNSYRRREQRRLDAQDRWVAGNESGLTVAQRESARGHDKRLRAELQAAGKMSKS